MLIRLMSLLICQTLFVQALTTLKSRIHPVLLFADCVQVCLPHSLV